MSAIPLKDNKGLRRHSTIRLGHVNKGKLNKCTLKAHVDTLLCLTQ